MSHRQFAAGIAATAVLAFGLGLCRLARNDVWFDEAASLFFARQRGWAFFRAILTEDTHGPLYYGLLKLWTILFGEGAWTSRFPSVVASTVTVMVTARLGARLLGRSAGLLAAIFLALSPFHLFFAQEIRFYGPVECLVAIHVSCFVELLEGAARRRAGRAADGVSAQAPAPGAKSAGRPGLPPRWALPGFVASAAAFLLTFYLSGLILAAETLVWLVLWHRLVPRKMLIAFAAVAVPGLLWLPVALWQARNTHGSVAWIPSQGMAASLWQLYRTFVADRTFRWPDWLLMPALLAAFGAGTWACLRSRRAGQVLLVAWLAVPTAAVLLISAVRPLYQSRYLLLTLPAFFLLLSAGLVRVRSPWAFWPVTMAAAVALFAADVRYFREPKFPDRWNEAALYLRQRARPDDRLVAAPSHEIATLLHYFPDFAIKHGINGPDEVQPLLSHGSDLWLFSRPKEFPDLPKRIARRAAPLESHDFGTLRLNRFAAP